MRYGLGVSREINAGGHHFLYGGISGGVHYWDNKDFSEQSLRLSFGHQNRSVTRSFGTVPFVGQNLLGGSRYNFAGGFNADFSRRLGERWRLTLNAGNMWKHYQEDRTAARYGSHMPLAGATLMYPAPKDRLLYGGADWPHDMTKEAEQASVRKGLRVGAVKTFDGGLGLRANLRYTRRTFDAPGTYCVPLPAQRPRISGKPVVAARQNLLEGLYAATQFPLSENRQQYEKFLHTQKYADFHERGKGFQISAKNAVRTFFRRHFLLSETYRRQHP